MPHLTIFHADNGSITLRKVTSKNICHKQNDHRNLHLIPCKIQPTICQKPHKVDELHPYTMSLFTDLFPHFQMYIHSRLPSVIILLFISILLLYDSFQ